MSPEEFISQVGEALTQKNSFVSPVARSLYLKGFRAVLPGNTPDGKVRGVLFGRISDGEVVYHGFGVHFCMVDRSSPYVVVKNYLDFVAVREIAYDLTINPVLTAVCLERTARIFNLYGFKVDRPDYGKFLILPVEEKGGIWKLKAEDPSRFKERFLSLIDAANELDDEIFELGL